MLHYLFIWYLIYTGYLSFKMAISLYDQTLKYRDAKQYFMSFTRFIAMFLTPFAWLVMIYAYFAVGYLINSLFLGNF